MELILFDQKDFIDHQEHLFQFLVQLELILTILAIKKNKIEKLD